MRGEAPEHGAVSLSIRFEPGPPAGSWQVTLTGANDDDVIQFSSALDLLRWLEDLERGPHPPRSGLR
jgi:hypothetical protein